MIVFCEDCGDKNSITPGHIKDNYIVFVCRSCGYHNRQAVVPRTMHRPPADNDTSGSRKRLAEFYRSLKTDPGVIGCFLYHSVHGIINSQMPETLTSDALRHLAVYVTSRFETAGRSDPSLSEAVFKLDKSAAAVFRILPDLFFILITIHAMTDNRFHAFIRENIDQIRILIDAAEPE